MFKIPNLHFLIIFEVSNLGVSHESEERRTCVYQISPNQHVKTKSSNFRDRRWQQETFQIDTFYRKVKSVIIMVGSLDSKSYLKQHCLNIIRFLIFPISLLCQFSLTSTHKNPMCCDGFHQKL